MIAKQSLKMCIVVLGATLFLQTSAAMAEVVTTGQTAAQNPTDVEKYRVQAVIDREDVVVRLQALGVAESMAKVRVAAMTDQEVQVMAQKLDAMPAGGRLRDSDLVVILLIVLLILII